MDDEQDDDNARTVVPARHVPSVPAGLQDATIPIVLLVLEWINGNEILWRHQTPIPRVAAAVVVAIIMVMMMMVTALPGTEDVSNGLDRPSCRASNKRYHGCLSAVRLTYSATEEFSSATDYHYPLYHHHKPL